MLKYIRRIAELVSFKASSFNAADTVFNSKNIKKYSPVNYSLDFEVSDGPLEHSPTVLEVLEIAKTSYSVVAGVSMLIFFDIFYRMNPDRLACLREAPKHVQQQYLYSFNTSHDYLHIEDFMKLAKAYNYPDSLFKSTSDSKKNFGMHKKECIIPVQTLTNGFIYEDSKGTPYEAQDLARKIAYIKYTTLNNGVRRLEDDVSAWLSGCDKMQRVFSSDVFISSCYLLLECYSKDLILEVCERFDTSTPQLSINSLAYLLSNWDEYKDYPIEWALELYST